MPETQDDAAFGAVSTVQPKFVAKSDLAAQWVRAEVGRADFAYATNYLIDTKSSVITDVEATLAIRQAEVGASQIVPDRTESRFGTRPDWLAVDTANGSSDNRGWLIKERGIMPFNPVIDHANRKDSAWTQFGFEYDEAKDQYTCPEGFVLREFRRNHFDPYRGRNIRSTRKYLALKSVCRGVPSKKNAVRKRFANRSAAKSVRARGTSHDPVGRRRPTRLAATKGSK